MSQGRQYRERLQYQLRFYVDREMYPTREEADRAKDRARKVFLQSGQEIEGVRIEARWRNPDNRNPAHANWKTTEDPGQSLMDFWQSLGRGRGALR
jgi:hypothetical protein